ncbi:MAG TPA: Hsp20/alpha crystallin family protein [Myxococcota bacterium]|nr:Hsp20/alpha crystallin family protein [Myxococcota bacterium]
MTNQSTTAQEGSTTPELQSREKQAVERETTRGGPVFRADVDIVERAEEYLVTADLPGVQSGDVQVRLEGGVLSIETTRGFTPEPGWTPLYSEYVSGGFYREFRLSDQIDVGRISAKMHDGVLELRLPKAELHRPRRIDVTN